MRSSASLQNQMETASQQSGGGCFSLLLFPPVSILLIILIFFLITAGETTVTGAGEKHGSNKQVETGKASGEIAPLFTPEVQRWSGSIVKWADDWDMDPNLVATVMQVESCGDPKAQSYAGAIGLFQVMPFHFQATDVPQKPATNAKRGLAYLRQGLDELGEPRLALAGYNGGIGVAAMGEEYWPPETARYVYWAEHIYRDAQKGRSYSEFLEDWLAHGGSVLCAQANQRLGLAK